MTDKQTQNDCLSRAVTCFIAIGSNLEDSHALNRTALQDMAALQSTRLEQASSLYQSDPVGPQDQPKYINSVAQIATELEPHALLDGLQKIETAHGRVRDRRWGPRTLDLDILLYGDQIIQTPRLSVPHVQMTSRAFVLMPLSEIAPDVMIPGVGALSPWLAALSDQGIEKIRADAGSEPV